MAFEILDGVLVKYYPEANQKTVVVPDGVKAIGKEAFAFCKNLLYVFFPDSLLFIGEEAFLYCRDLYRIIVPESVTEIASGAFSNSGLRSIVLPKRLTSIANQLFKGCNKLESVEMPEAVLSIGRDAFAACRRLCTIRLPEGLKSIGSYAFGGCDSLEEIPLPESITDIALGAFSSCREIREIKLPPALTEIYKDTFASCYNLSSISFGQSIRLIAGHAFHGCKSLTSISLPDSIVEIVDGAFEGCQNLAIAHMPAGRKEITSKSFKNSSALSKDSLKMARDSETFTALFNLLNASEKREWAKEWMRDSTSCPEVSQKRLSSYVIKEKTNIVKSIIKEQDSDLLRAAMSMKLIDGKNADDIQAYAIDAQNDELVSMLSVYVVENSTKSDWGKKTNKGTNISTDSVSDLKKEWKWVVNADKETCTITEYRGEDPDVIVPQTIGGKTVTAIGDGAFSPEHVRLIKRRQWLEDSLKSVVLPEGIITIGEDAFFRCYTLQHVELPITLQSIGRRGFCTCTSLDNIVLPKSLLSIGSYGFAYCRKLTKIAMPPSLTYLGGSEFENCNSVTHYGGSVCENFSYYSYLSPSAYKQLKSFFYPGGAVFENCESLVEVSIGESLSEIPDRCFYDCQKLEGIELPTSIKRLGSYAFGGCSSLKQLFISKHVEAINSGFLRKFWGENSFSCKDSNFYSATQIKIDPDSPVFAVKDHLLLSKDLKKLIDYLPGCVGELRLPATIEEMPKKIFYGYPGITSVYIPGTIKVIPEGAFSFCRNLTTVYIEEGVEVIEDRAFTNCESLQMVKLPASLTNIERGAFLSPKLKEVAHAPEGSYAAFCAGQYPNADKDPAHVEMYKALSEATEGLPKEEKKRIESKAVLDDWISGGEGYDAELLSSFRHIDKLTDEEVRGIAGRMLGIEHWSMINWVMQASYVVHFLTKCYKGDPREVYRDVLHHFRKVADKVRYNTSLAGPMGPYYASNILDALDEAGIK